MAYGAAKTYPLKLGGVRTNARRYNIRVMKFFLTLFGVLPMAVVLAGDGDALTAAALAESLDRASRCAFSLRVLVSSVVRHSPQESFLSVSDDSGSIFLFCQHGPNTPLLSPGDVIEAQGRLQTIREIPTPVPIITNAVVRARQTPRPAIDVSIQDVNRGLFNWQPVRIRGLIRDAFRSETSREWGILSICDEESILRIHVPLSGTSLEALSRLTGRIVCAEGFPNPHSGSFRIFAGCDFQCPGLSHIKIIDNSDSDHFSVPSAGTLLHKSPLQIATSGRVKASGTVLCTWSGNRAIIATDTVGCIQAQFSGTNLPPRQTHVEVSGFPQSDLFHLLLTQAEWKPDGGEVRRTSKVLKLTAHDIFPERSGSASYAQARLHGHTVSISGRVHRLTDERLHAGTILIDDGNLIFSVDVSSVPAVHDKLEVGCQIAVTGICLINAEYWRPGRVIPQLRNFSVIVSDEKDIEILSYPPWWTPIRLLFLVCVLLAVLMAILVWNASLRRLATRKGRDLMREQLSLVSAELKTEERTRLAVELHDSLAQNLTGVSLEIDTASKLADEDHCAMLAHLSTAAQSLKSCRDELRNCLWDLRNRALEAKTMDEAIRQTLVPHVSGVGLSIRFNVPRECISDNTAHAILRIIRELTLNGIRHGGATKIRIAGSVEGDRLFFSVRDNGRGFDPDAAPGFDKGHYGLLGIRERIDEFEGEFSLTSAPSKGTKAVISLKAPQEIIGVTAP